MSELAEKIVDAVLILLFGLIVGFVGAWYVQSLRYESKMNAQTVQGLQSQVTDLQTVVQKAEDLQQQRDALQQELTKANDTYAHDMAQANKTITDLRANVANGTVQLRVAATCQSKAPTTGAAGGSGLSGNQMPGAPASGSSVASPFAVLTPAAGSAYFSLRSNIAANESALSACQASLKAFSTPPPQQTKKAK